MNAYCRAMLVFVLFSSSVNATVVINSQGDMGIIDGALFVAPPDNISANDSLSFLDLRDTNDADDVESGFNSFFLGSSGSCVGCGEKDGTSLIDPSGAAVNDQEQSKDLPLSLVPKVTIDGMVYRQFAVAINPTSDETEITKIQIGQDDTNDVGVWANLDKVNVYTMSSDTVRVDGGVGSGTNIDMFLYVKDNLFDQSKQFVYLFSEMGTASFPASGGQDRWITSRSSVAFVPEPGSFLILTLVTVSMGGVRWRRRVMTVLRQNL